MRLEDYIAEIPDYPVEGVLFRDITPLLNDGEAFHAACKQIIAFAKGVGAEVLVGPESRLRRDRRPGIQRLYFRLSCRL